MAPIPHDRREKLRALVAGGMPVKRAAHAAGVKYASSFRIVRDCRPPRFDPPSKTCAVCGTVFTPPGYATPSRWKVRKVCGPSCCAAARQRGAA